MPPCIHPRAAWRLASGAVALREPVDRTPAVKGLRLPCGSCLSCRANQARDWSIRCQLELREHPVTVWSTLTYDDYHLPPTLRRDHLASFVKRLRARLGDRRFRFFASGEYGEKTSRPHYHMIHFGLGAEHERDIQAAWQKGLVRVDPISPAAISYVAGYTSKKIGWKLEPRERVDPETGECYTWQPPFLHMSRRPGIGGEARRHFKAWRESAIVAGREVPVPRFLHQAWLKHASDEQLAELEAQREASYLQPLPSTADINYFADKLRATALMVQRKQADQALKRSV